MKTWLTGDLFCGVGEWPFAFDGSSTYLGGGPGVILYAHDGTNIPLAFKLQFLFSSNEAEYEAMIIGQISAL